LASAKSLSCALGDARRRSPRRSQGGAGAEHGAADRSQQAAGLGGLLSVCGGWLSAAGATSGPGVGDRLGLARLGLVAVLLLLADLDDGAQHLQALDGLLAVLELDALVGDELLVVADRGLGVLRLLVDAADVEEDRRLGLDCVGALEQRDGAGVVLVLELAGRLGDEGVEGLGLAAPGGGRREVGRCGRLLKAPRRPRDRGSRSPCR
jgi:hypothetical protein